MEIIKNAAAWSKYKDRFEYNDSFTSHKNEPDHFPCFVFTKYLGTQKFNTCERSNYEHSFIYKEDFKKLED